MKNLILALYLLIPAICIAAPQEIKMKSGSVFKGEVTNWDGNAVSIKGDFGSITLQKDQLDPATVTMLSAKSGDSSALQSRIAELEKQVASLLRDNQALRAQLQSAPTATTSSPTRTTTPTAATSAVASKEPDSTSASFWISSTGKRHNPSCRYYKTSKGAPGTAGQGEACKICGG